MIGEGRAVVDVFLPKETEVKCGRSGESLLPF